MGGERGHDRNNFAVGRRREGMGACASKSRKQETKLISDEKEEGTKQFTRTLLVESPIAAKEAPNQDAPKLDVVIDSHAQLKDNGKSEITLLSALGITKFPACTMQSALLGPVGLLLGVVLGPVALGLVFAFIALVAMPNIVAHGYQATVVTVRLGIWAKLWLVLTLPLLGLLGLVCSAVAGVLAGIVWGGAAGFTLFGFCENISPKYDALVTQKFAPLFPRLLNYLIGVCAEELPLDHPAFELSPTAAVTGLLLACYGLAAGLLAYVGIALYKLPGNLSDICKAFDCKGRSVPIGSCNCYVPGCLLLLVSPFLLIFLVLFELITLVVVPIYGTIASGYGALSETYAHNLKYRRAQMKGAGCPQISCTLVGDVLGINGIPNGLATVWIRARLHCKGEDDSAAVVSALKPLVFLCTVGNLAHGIFHNPWADATFSSLIVINLGVMVYKLRKFQKKMEEAELL